MSNFINNVIKKIVNKIKVRKKWVLILLLISHNKKYFKLLFSSHLCQLEGGGHLLENKGR